MDQNLRSHLSVKHAILSDRLTEQDVEAAFEAVRPIAERAGGAAPQLLGLSDPFEAEVHGAVALSALLCLPIGQDRIGVAMLAALIGRGGDAAASALLHAIEVVTAGPAKTYITTEIELLEGAGVPCPPWESGLDDPVESVSAWACSPVMESGGAPHAVLVFEFSRAGSTHAFIIHRDYQGDGSIRKVNGIPDIGWHSFRKFLLTGKALEVPYAIEEMDFNRAVDHFDAPRMAMWRNLSEDPDRFAADTDLSTAPGMTLLLETHMTAAM
ncbi:hypothetical protein L0U85_19885 [Glycomyces sp. L485]|uniref:hypothetical protein n=1 Tax=Glycomyces sp. L485 TaxID=2909235 RepID=UPI001F4AC94E|nr:hypothetical protein [Glycomyces sp. L485]MCH7233098.1 hypothetical protein [Glycomyces sp. L485]